MWWAVLPLRSVSHERFVHPRASHRPWEHPFVWGTPMAERHDVHDGAKRSVAAGWWHHCIVAGLWAVLIGWFGLSSAIAAEGPAAGKAKAAGKVQAATGKVQAAAGKVQVPVPAAVPATASAPVAASAKEPPTFTRDVAPIL